MGEYKQIDRLFISYDLIDLLGSKKYAIIVDAHYFVTEH